MGWAEQTIFAGLVLSAGATFNGFHQSSVAAVWLWCEISAQLVPSCRFERFYCDMCAWLLWSGCAVISALGWHGLALEGGWKVGQSRAFVERSSGVCSGQNPRLLPYTAWHVKAHAPFPPLCLFSVPLFPSHPSILLFPSFSLCLLCFSSPLSLSLSISLSFSPFLLPSLPIPSFSHTISLFFSFSVYCFSAPSLSPLPPVDEGGMLPHPLADGG